MSYYQPNPACRCARCRTRGITGPAVLITVGVLFLVANSTTYDFERTWPVLIIVIGVCNFIRYVLPPSEHLNPGQPPSYEPFPPNDPSSGATPAEMNYGGASPRESAGTSAVEVSMVPTAPIITPPPAPIAGQLNPPAEDDKGEVHHG